MSSFRDWFEVPEGFTLEKIKRLPEEKRKEFRLKKDVETVIRDLKRKGLTDRKIATEMGINFWTFNDWKRTFPHFPLLLKKGKKEWMGEIVDSAFKTAKGYFVIEEKTVVTKHSNGKITELKEKNKRWIAPHSGIIKYILSTQDPEYWREKIEFNEENNAAFETFSKAVNNLTQNDDKGKKP